MLTDAAVLAVAEGLPGITHLDLSSNKVTTNTNTAMKTLVSKCRELECLDLSYSEVGDGTLHKIAEQCSKLPRVLCVHGTCITAVGLTYLALKCSKLLKTVYVSGGREEDEEDEEEVQLVSLRHLFPHIHWVSICTYFRLVGPYY